MAGRKKDPALLTALDALLAEETAGDPCGPLKWKRKSLHQLSAALSPAHPASAPTVARLLRAQHYSPKVNHKVLAASSPHRDAQFQYLQGQKQAFLQQGWPVISADTKKREYIGCFKNAGVAWCQEAPRVNVYDFRSLADGIAIPYGIYDLARNEGFVYLGISADTAEFAVDALGWWWFGYAQPCYGGVPAVLILADGGGSNGYRSRLWKYSLQAWVNRTGLACTVCHYPPGASKWNPVEHRLFSPVSGNWAGQPLTSYALMLGLIQGTTTQEGLIVHATLNDRPYQKGREITDEDMAGLNVRKHDTFPNWNYTIMPVAN